LDLPAKRPLFDGARRQRRAIFGRATDAAGAGARKQVEVRQRFQRLPKHQNCGQSAATSENMW
jgi:hypothetical protein